jgi:hypothetical protein
VSKLIVFTPEQVIEVETLAAVLNQEQISAYFGIDSDTFTAIKQRDPEVLRSYKRGKAKAILDIGGNLIEKAKGDNIAAAIFYLKTQAGWKETIDLSSSDGTMTPAKQMTDAELSKIASE